ncbi:hypothetical protein FOZ61_000501 [Perkinsus olseni]|uniref:Uncharacterized protein n=1 Tax=Perkinsus olseni TaxID=32597 RepID=A0A7J6KTP4_PEROL|nr:hypothetical protein FOZ61_000501 [Perkinsus olseni]
MYDPDTYAACVERTRGRILDHVDQFINARGAAYQQNVAGEVRRRRFFVGQKVLLRIFRTAVPGHKLQPRWQPDWYVKKFVPGTHQKTVVIVRWPDREEKVISIDHLSIDPVQPPAPPVELGLAVQPEVDVEFPPVPEYPFAHVIDDGTTTLRDGPATVPSGPVIPSAPPSVAPETPPVTPAPVVQQVPGDDWFGPYDPFEGQMPTSGSSSAHEVDHEHDAVSLDRAVGPNDSASNAPAGEMRTPPTRTNRSEYHSIVSRFAEVEAGDEMSEAEAPDIPLEPPIRVPSRLGSPVASSISQVRSPSVASPMAPAPAMTSERQTPQEESSSSGDDCAPTPPRSGSNDDEPATDEREEPQERGSTRAMTRPEGSLLQGSGRPARTRRAPTRFSPNAYGPGGSYHE